MSILKYWIWLSALHGLRRKTANRLLEKFETPEKIFFAQDNEFEDVEGINAQDLEALKNRNLTKAKRILDDCDEMNYRIVTLSDADYPTRLKNIYDPPILFYVWGKLPVVDERVTIAVVGTRKCTPYGSIAAKRMGHGLATKNCIVVSGLALGIDAAAAEGALEGGGKVIGVLGCGLDIAYPPANKLLISDVASQGAVISEYPPGYKVMPGNFPARNRIMSGISNGVVVVEAPMKSGALITANLALEQGRDVFAIPGNVDAPASTGSNRLIKEGAIMVTEANDVVEEYADIFPEVKEMMERQRGTPEQRELLKQMLSKIPRVRIHHVGPKKEIDKVENEEYIDVKKVIEKLPEKQKMIANVLKSGKKHIDDIVAQSGVSSGPALAALTILQVDGVVNQKPGKIFYIAGNENGELFEKQSGNEE